MAIGYGSSVDGGNNSGSTNSLTFAFNNVAGTIVFVGFVGDSVGGNDDITGVTYGGDTCDFIDKRSAANGDRKLYLYVRQNPKTGSNNVVISCTNNHYLYAGAVSYTGAATTTQPDNSTTSDSTNRGVTSWATSLSSVADNCWHMLVEGSYSAGGAPGAGASTTRRVYGVSDGPWGLFDSNAAKTPAGSVTLTTTRSGSPDAIEHVMASFKPAATAAVLVQAHYRWRNDDGRLWAP